MREEPHKRPWFVLKMDVLLQACEEAFHHREREEVTNKTRSRDDDALGDNSCHHIDKRRKCSNFNTVYETLKCDTRSKLPRMFTNVLNSGEASLLHDFIERYFSPECTFWDFFPNATGKAVPLLRVEGKEKIEQQLSLVFDRCPDFTMKLLRTHVSPDRGGKSVFIVSCFADFYATRAFCVKNGDDCSERFEKFLDFLQSPRSTTYNCCSPTFSCPDRQQVLPPRLLHVSGSMLFYLDHMLQVNRLEFILSPQNSGECLL